MFELKREKLTRDAVAQILDYCTYLETLSDSDLAILIAEQSGKHGIAIIEIFDERYVTRYANRAGNALRPVKMVLVGLGMDMSAYLSSHPNEADPIHDDIGYDLGRVRKVVRVSVCLEDFGSIQSSLMQLEDTGWLPACFTPCPTMNLADFETIFDLLDHPVHILHYLMKREVIEASVGCFADLLDLLDLYLTTLLDIPDVEPDVEVTFTGMSAPLDTYYNSLDAGVTLDKPRPAISPLFASIFSQLEQRGVARWTEIGVTLKMFSPDDQRRITKMLTKLQKRVHRNWRKQGHKNTVICIPSRASSYALGYVMFKNGNANLRRNFMESAAATALESDHVHTVIVIGRNIDRDDAAYHSIALFEATSRPSR